MKFNLDDLNPAAWFDHPTENGRIQVRALSVEELQKINKKTTRTKIEYRRGQRFEVEIVDQEENQNLTWDYCITDWENILDQDENPMPCTLENKKLLMRKAPKFAGWVTDCLNQLGEDNSQRQEEAEKNSLSSQNE